MRFTRVKCGVGEYGEFMDWRRVLLTDEAVW